MSKDFQNGVALGLAMGGVVEVEIPAKPEQEKTITITENGTTEILPDENKALSKVTVVTEVSGGSGETETVVEYIESTGTQYIDTGVIPINHRVKAKMQLLKKSDSAIGLFGVMGSDYSKCYGVSYYNNTWYYYAGDRHTTTNFAYSDLIEFDLNNENNEFVVNGEVIGTVNGTCSTTFSMPIFARTNTTSASIQGSSQSNARLYYFQIYDKTTNELVRNFVPAIDENGVVCLYDKITQAYFYNQGVGEFVGKFVEKVGITPLDHTVTFTVDGEPYEIISVKNGVSVNEPIPLENTLFAEWKDTDGNTISFPYIPTSDIAVSSQTLAYQVVDYIESTGKQTIDTGIYPYKTEIYLKARYMSNVGTSPCSNFLAGCYNANNQRYYVAKYEQGFSCSTKSNNIIVLASKIPTDDFEIIYNNDNNEVVFNGEVKGTIPDLNYTASNPLTLFSQSSFENGQVTHNNHGAYRLYACKIRDKETNTLLRDFIPVIDPYGVACLYDNVTKEFFYNIGTGIFKTN